MRPKSRRQHEEPGEPAGNAAPRARRRSFSANEKIGLVIKRLQGEDSVAGLCRKEGIARSRYYAWAKEFREDCERRLAGPDADTVIGDPARTPSGQ